MLFAPSVLGLRITSYNVCYTKLLRVGKGQVGKGGVVRDPVQHVAVVERVRAEAEALGCTTLGVTESPLLGQKGNREFLIHLRKECPT